MVVRRPNNYKYTDYELKCELTAVFQSVYFINKREKKKLADSYFLNFPELIGYARANHIDEKRYIRSIRGILLSCPQTYRVR